MVSFPEPAIELLLVGDPVSHSRSPRLHEAALRALGRPGRYRARRVDAVELVDVAAEMRDETLDGVNITMPHKVAAAGLCDALSAEATRAGSVNTWVLQGGRMVGYSTDVHGVRDLFQRFPPSPVTVLGSGGAAAAALVALGDPAGPDRPIALRARSRQNAARLAESVGITADVGSWNEPAEAGVVVNCTPIGMRRGERLPARFLSTATGLLDMAYGSHVTVAVSEARSRRIPYADGIDLLVAQAEESFRLWTGQRPPDGVMQQAARGGMV